MLLTWGLPQTYVRTAISFLYEIFIIFIFKRARNVYDEGLQIIKCTSEIKVSYIQFRRNLKVNLKQKKINLPRKTYFTEK